MYPGLERRSERTSLIRLAGATIELWRGWYNKLDPFEMVEAAKYYEKDDMVPGALSNRAGLSYLNALASDFEGRVATVVFLDIDRFKAINDSYNHQVGDECIRQFGDYLVRSTREKEAVVIRKGGDEFTLVFSMPASQVEDIMGRLLREIPTFFLEHIALELFVPIRVSFSYGMSQRRLSSGMSVSQWMTEADVAMYEHKGVMHAA